MVDKLLPSELWFFAINYAVQLSNYLSVKTDTSTLTAPHFEAYSQKQDNRKVLPLFSIACVRLYDSVKGNTFSSQTVKAILVGNNSKSDGRLFYNPITKRSCDPVTTISISPIREDHHSISSTMVDSNLICLTTPLKQSHLSLTLAKQCSSNPPIRTTRQQQPPSSLSLFTSLPRILSK